MKKELLLATTIAGVALGATSASAVTSSLSGNHRVGLLDVDKDSSNATTGTTNENIKSSLSYSLSETLDSGTTIAGVLTTNEYNMISRLLHISMFFLSYFDFVLTRNPPFFSFTVGSSWINKKKGRNLWTPGA